MPLRAGTFMAEVLWHALTESSRNQTAQIAVGLKVEIDGEDHTITWYGAFTDNPDSVEISLNGLRNLGWDPAAHQFDIAALNGTDVLVGNQCQVVLVDDEWEGKPRIKVQFINRIGGAEPMNDVSAKSLADRIKGQVIAYAQSNPAISAPKAEAKPKPAADPNRPQPSQTGESRPSQIPDDINRTWDDDINIDDIPF